LIERDQIKFEAFSYRTSARFGSVVEIEVKDNSGQGNYPDENTDKLISITGPRIGGGSYWTWIIIQVILMLCFIPAVIIPIVLGHYYYLFFIPALFLVHLAVGGLGAAAFWEMARLISFDKDREENTISFKKSGVKNVKIGKGWARGIIWLAIPYFIPLVNTSAIDICVSFEAPGSAGETNLVYAMHMRTKEDAAVFAKLLV